MDSEIKKMLAPVFEPLGSEARDALIAAIESEIENRPLVQQVVDEDDQIWTLGEPSKLTPAATVFAMIYDGLYGAVVYCVEPVQDESGATSVQYIVQRIVKIKYVSGPATPTALVQDLLSMLSDDEEPDAAAPGPEQEPAPRTVHNGSA